LGPLVFYAEATKQGGTAESSSSLADRPGLRTRTFVFLGDTMIFRRLRFWRRRGWFLWRMPRLRRLLWRRWRWVSRCHIARRPTAAPVWS